MKMLILGTAFAAGALILAPEAAASIPTGDYDFNLPRLQPISVHIEQTGAETVKLTAPSGSKVEMHLNRRGNRYEGMASDPHGAMCGKTPMLADVFYSIDTDGMGGIVEVKGQPCGPGVAIAPLIFNLTARAA
jgi:hypothetical protein